MPVQGRTPAWPVHPKSLSATVCCRASHLNFQLRWKAWKKEVADMVKRDLKSLGIYGSSGLFTHLAVWACLKVNEPLSFW